MENKLICLCILAVIIIIFVFIKSKWQTASVEFAEKFDEKIEKDNKVEDDTKGSAIIYSKEFADKTEPTKDQIVKSFLVKKEDRGIWICPNCEVENVISSPKCCVCHYEREKK